MGLRALPIWPLSLSMPVSVPGGPLYFPSFIPASLSSFQSVRPDPKGFVLWRAAAWHRAALTVSLLSLSFSLCLSAVHTDTKTPKQTLARSENRP